MNSVIVLCAVVSGEREREKKHEKKRQDCFEVTSEWASVKQACTGCVNARMGKFKIGQKKNEIEKRAEKKCASFYPIRPSNVCCVVDSVVSCTITVATIFFPISISYSISVPACLQLFHLLNTEKKNEGKNQRDTTHWCASSGYSSYKLNEMI